MSSFVELQLGGMLLWRVSEEGPREVALSAFPGWAVVPPHLASNMGSGGEEVSQPARLATGDYLVSTRALTFRMPDSGPVLRPAMKFRDVMLEIARRLRFVSRQFEIPRRFAAFSHLEGTGDLPPPIPFEHLFGSSGAMVRDYMVATAITREHLEQLAALPADFTIPAHADILVATGLRGDHFHRFHRYPGDHPVISTRFLA